jgi:methylmalonyl-CoA mutase cobalamin-binding domain/chain
VERKMADQLTDHIVSLRREEALAEVHRRVDSGADPLAVLEACRQGMTRVGELFQEGEYYLSELLLSAELFKEVSTILEPGLARLRSAKPLGKVVLATMQGDIHDLGKNILVTLLEVNGFEVHDLGVDVAPEDLLEKVREIAPDIVGFSSLLTTSFESSKRAAELLREAGLRDELKLIVGGGVTTPAFKDYVQADFQTLDATEGVAYCVEALGGPA